MEIATEEYKGYTITVTPMQDNGGLWDFAYCLTGHAQDKGAAEAAISRSKTAGGYNSPAIARSAGLQVGRTEVDNLLAMHGKQA